MLITIILSALKEREAKQTYIYLQGCFFVCWRVTGVFYDKYFLIAMWNDLVNLKRSERVKWCKVPYFDLLKR